VVHCSINFRRTDEDCDFSIKWSVSRNTVSLVLRVEALLDECAVPLDLLIVAAVMMASNITGGS